MFERNADRLKTRQVRPTNALFVSIECYGAHCRCVFGLGLACSDVAALLFALEDFSACGLQRLRGPSVTEKICKWCKPCAQKVEPLPLSKLVLEKASPGERKRKRWVRNGISNYDPRHPEDRIVDKRPSSN